MECSKQNSEELKVYCVSLLRICSENKLIEVNEQDHLGFTSLCFLSKQMEHMDSVLHLYPRSDMQLISRTMIEGLTQLLWCFKEPERAYQWKKFVWIEDWRKTKEETGESIPSEYRKRIDRIISDYGDEFKINRYKNSPIIEGCDPFHRNWRCGKSLKEISDAVGGEVLYKMLYSPFSDWQHWGVASLGKRLRRHNKWVSYSINPEDEDICSSLAVAFQCLFQIMGLVDLHFQIELDEQLGDLKESYVKSQT